MSVFKDFQGLENLEKIQGLSRTFKDLQEPCLPHQLAPWINGSYLDMVKTSPCTFSWWELPMIQSVRYSTSLLRNFISCLNVRSSRRNIIASTSWHTFVFICIAWIVESRCRTYLTIVHRISLNKKLTYCCDSRSYCMQYFNAIHCDRNISTSE